MTYAVFPDRETFFPLNQESLRTVYVKLRRKLKHQLSFITYLGLNWGCGLPIKYVKRLIWEMRMHWKRY